LTGIAGPPAPAPVPFGSIPLSAPLAEAFSNHGDAGAAAASVAAPPDGPRLPGRMRLAATGDVPDEPEDALDAGAG
jgi:hypothetical protein